MKKPRNPFAKEEEELPPDIVYLEDRSLHGWLDKQSKKGGIFSSWKRVFVTVEHLKLRYYKDSERSFEDPAEAEFVKDEKNSRVADEDPIRPKVTSSPELPKHH